MKKELVFLLGAISISVSLILLSLLHFSDSPNRANNGFTRTWLSNIITSQKIMPVEQNFYKISGHTNQCIFLSGKDPRIVTLYKYSTGTTDSIILPIAPNIELLRGFTIQVDSPTVYLFANNLSTIVTANILDTQINFAQLPSSLFTRAATISNTTVVLRAFDSSATTQKIVKANVQNGQITKAIGLFPNQLDAGFSTDGLLTFDRTTNCLIYVQFYQNKFYCLDTSLNLIYTSRTIDTTFTNTVSTRQFLENKSGSILPSVPLNPINIECCTSEGLLYITSSLQADNETNTAFRENTVIDVYRITDGSYKGSFYLSNIEGKKALSFKIFEKKCVALFPNHVAIYDLDI